MRLPSAVVLALVLLLASLAPAAPAAAMGATTPADAPESTAVAAVDAQPTNDTPDAPDRADPWQVIRLSITDDGDAEWSVESRYAIESAADADAFEAFAAAVAAGETDADAGFDLGAIETFVDRADADREMAIEDTGWAEPRIEPADVEPSPENETVGVVTKTFTWTNFADPSREGLEIGDAWHADGDPLFGSLIDGQRLVVESPDNFSHVGDTVPTLPRNGALVWDGPETFDPDELRWSYFEQPTVERYTLSATVADADGDPLAGVDVTLTDADGDESSLETDENGEVTFSELPDGEYTLSATADGQEFTETVTVDGADERATLSAAPSEPGTHALTAVLETSDGDLLAGTTVTLAGPGGDRIADTDENGEVTFTELPDGEYTLSATVAEQEFTETVTVDGADESTTLSADPSDADPPEPGTHALTAVLETSDGDLLAGTTVTLVGPDGDEVSLETDENGEVTFTELPDGEYTLSATADDQELTETVTVDGADERATLTVESTAGNGGLSLDASLLAAVAGVLVVLAVSTLLAYVFGLRPDTDADESGSETAVEADASSGEDDPAGSSGTVVSMYSEAELDGSADAAAGAADDADAVDVDLLSDEERVHRLLRHNDGRMKQASIVDETGWSNAKVSQLLSKMDDDGEIDKLRIGRENLITLPEVDPTRAE